MPRGAIARSDGFTYFHFIKPIYSGWWYKFVILERISRQGGSEVENYKFKVSLGNLLRTCFKKKKKIRGLEPHLSGGAVPGMCETFGSTFRTTSNTSKQAKQLAGLLSMSAQDV